MSNDHGLKKYSDIMDSKLKEAAMGTCEDCNCAPCDCENQIKEANMGNPATAGYANEMEAIYNGLIKLGQKIGENPRIQRNLITAEKALKDALYYLSL